MASGRARLRAVAEPPARPASGSPTRACSPISIPRCRSRCPHARRPSGHARGVDAKHRVLVVEVDGFPRKAYPLGGTATLDGRRARTLALRPGDRAELRAAARRGAHREGTAAHDTRRRRHPRSARRPDRREEGPCSTPTRYTPRPRATSRMKYPSGDVPRDDRRVHRRDHPRRPQRRARSPEGAPRGHRSARAPRTRW